MGFSGSGKVLSMVTMISRLSVMSLPSISIAGSSPLGILFRNDCGLSPYERMGTFTVS